MSNGLIAGSAQVDISPEKSLFLFGYPHVERNSTGIHDALYSSSLYLSDDREHLLFIANDIIFVSKALCARVRANISAETGLSENVITISATHTHSGPITANCLSNESDLTVPPADKEYLDLLEQNMVKSACAAFNSAVPAEVGLVTTEANGIGTNRHAPEGCADPEVPVMMVRAKESHKSIACMVVYSMHPTVLHEDSTLISGDFPGLARQYLQEKILGGDCPLLYHTGPAGNQSPRYITRGNTLSETKRLGFLLGQSIADAIANITFSSDIHLSTGRTLFDLERRNFPSIGEAERKLKRARETYSTLIEENAPRPEIRTAECSCFGAEETLTLAKAAVEGRLETACQGSLPAEVFVAKIGPWTFACWPGEFFVEYALDLKATVDNCFVISLANGELQGYIVTQEAADEGGYEASNALFSESNGSLFVLETQKLIKQITKPIDVSKV